MLNCVQIKNLMMDYLYGELSELDKPLFEEHLQSCADCQKELQALQETTGILAQWQDGEAALPLTAIPKKNRWKKGLLQEYWPLYRPAYIFSMAAMLLLFLLAAFNTRISSENGRWQLSMSLFPQKDKPSLPEGSVVLSKQDLLAIEQDRWKLIQAFVQQSEMQQRREWTAALSHVAQTVQQQRHQDLQIVSRGLEAVGQETAQRLQLTDQVLAEVLRLTSTEQNQIR
jgi:hypothetical protein